MPSKPSNVIPFTMNADFFNDIAAKSLERYNYSKAMRYFKRALELEPGNPEHFFNLAGVLARLGKFHESNKVLYEVLQKMGVHPDCHYYLACNYTNLDMLDKAEEHILKYLEQDPLGQYAVEAGELLDYLGTDLDSLPLQESDPDELVDEKTILHDEARALLEKGSFQQAEKILLQLIKDYPDFLAASNNLSLCYYYEGEFQKAMDTILSVLRTDPSNIHALCNLAVIYYHFNEEKNLTELMDGLKKVVPLQYDQAYKLGITLGVMGEHLAAFRIFKQMAAYAWQLDFQLFHYCAVAAYNLGFFKEAEKYWKLVQREDPGSTVASFYLRQVTEGSQRIKEIPYYYQLPLEYKKDKKYKSTQTFIQQEVEHDPFVRSSFLWALRYGDRETKLQVLQAFEWLGDEEVVEALHQFVQNPEQDEDLKKIASFVLKTLGHPASIREQMITWKDSWGEVLYLVQTWFPNEWQQEGSDRWADYVNGAYPDLPIIRKPEAWAAALEWLFWKESGEHRKKLQHVAEKYGVTAKTIKKHAETIEEYGSRR